MRRALFPLPLIASLLLPAAASAQGLEALADLARGGAPQLALRLIERGQPAVENDPLEWMVWERERIFILTSRGRHREVVERLATIPEGLPPHFRSWADTQRASALLELDDPRGARAVLRGLIWGEDAEAEAQAVWRRMVIRGYLQEGRVEEAHTAMLRYQQDYGDGGDEWRRLRARVLIRAGRFSDALELLGRDEAAEGRLLRLLAGLRLGAEEPAKVRRAAARMADDKRLEPTLRPQLRLLEAEAAEKGGEGERLVRALEQVFEAERLDASIGELFNIGVERLWRAYLDLGAGVGNREQLLIGQDDAWFAAAAEAEKKRRTQARALYAMLAFNAVDPERAAAAHGALLRLIERLGDGRRLARRLYLESGRFSELESVPETVRYGLLDHALAEGDIPRASKLMASLPRPPQGSDAAEWELRRARVLILGGDDTRGIEALEAQLAGGEPLPAERIDRLLQVIFDLQSVGRHREAIGLLHRLAARGADERQAREIPYWIADSHKALGEHEEAARLYLRSAGLYDPYALDQWAQSARYAAAEALVAAGLADDARTIYKGLLSVTKDPARQAVLRQKLQELWLVREEG